ncbi:hypothetical protein A3754_09040 [Alcanivorax sp. HI0083]|nr:hypothetical protein A3754_09040 [Alcanivorax sp. HI0083]
MTSRSLRQVPLLITFLLSLLLPALALATKQQAKDYLAAERLITHGNTTNAVRLYRQDASQGDYVTIIPSLGRGVADYTEQYQSTLVTRLVEAGYQVILIEPRGVGESKGELTPGQVSMEMLVDDVRLSLDAFNIKKVHMIGHAFGNRLSRTFATLYPERIDKLVLLAAGGNFEMSAEQKACLRGSITPTEGTEKRRAAIQCAFFAEGNSPDAWLTGWYPKLAMAQVHAARSIDGDIFKNAGGKPFLLIQPAQDFIAPPHLAGRPIKEELGAQVTYVELPETGHALTSERPDKVAEIMLDYFATESSYDRQRKKPLSGSPTTRRESKR